MEKKDHPQLCDIQLFLHMDIVFSNILSIVRTWLYTPLEIRNLQLSRLYSGQQTGPEPTWNICRTQAALVYAVPILYVCERRPSSPPANLFFCFQSGHSLFHSCLPGKLQFLTAFLINGLTMSPQLWLDIRAADSNKVVQRNFFSIRNLSVSSESLNLTFL